MNQSLSPSEAMALVGRRIRSLIEDGACRNCAIRMTAKKYNITKEQAVTCLLNYEAAP